MMAESVFADVLGNQGLGTLVFISFDQTFQTPPPTVTWRHSPASGVQRVWLRGNPGGRQAGEAWGHLSGWEPLAVGLSESGPPLWSD